MKRKRASASPPPAASPATRGSVSPAPKRAARGTPPPSQAQGGGAKGAQMPLVAGLRPPPPPPPPAIPRPFADVKLEDGWLMDVQINVGRDGFVLPASLAGGRAGKPAAPTLAPSADVVLRRPRGAPAQNDVSAADLIAMARAGRCSGLRVTDGWRRSDLLDDLKRYARGHREPVTDVVFSNRFVELLAWERAQQLLADADNTAGHSKSAYPDVTSTGVQTAAASVS